MASGPVFQTTLRLELPVWIRRSIVKDDGLVEIVSQQPCEGKKEGIGGGGAGLLQPSSHLKVKFHSDSDDLLASSFC